MVATPLLTQLLLGTLVPVDAKALLMSTLEASQLHNSTCTEQACFCSAEFASVH